MVLRNRREELAGPRNVAGRRRRQEVRVVEDDTSAMGKGSGPLVVRRVRFEERRGAHLRVRIGNWKPAVVVAPRSYSCQYVKVISSPSDVRGGGRQRARGSPGNGEVPRARVTTGGHIAMSTVATAPGTLPQVPAGLAEGGNHYQGSSNGNVSKLCAARFWLPQIPA
jgi:hypothetical protein